MLRPSGFLTEVARARVLIDLPGQGDFCFRLVDYLAIGSCIVAARHGNRLPVELVDGRDIVLVDTPAEAADACADLLRNPDRIEELAANARSYFDRHLSRRALAAHYLEQIVSRLMSEGDGWRAA
jgi:glycosyltransferase involved in cell wall biosynthesis